MLTHQAGGDLKRRRDREFRNPFVKVLVLKQEGGSGQKKESFEFYLFFHKRIFLLPALPPQFLLSLLKDERKSNKQEALGLMVKYVVFFKQKEKCVFIFLYICIVLKRDDFLSPLSLS